MQKPNAYYQSNGQPSAVVIFETNAARDALLQCSSYRLADFTDDSMWYSLAEIKGSNADKALRDSLSASLVIVAASANGDFPVEFKLWIERWSAKRSDRQGALVAMFYDRKLADLASVKELYLRQAAQAAGIEFRRDIPQTFAATVPDSLDSFTDRAGQMTSVLTGILSQRTTSVPPL